MWDWEEKYNMKRKKKDNVEFAESAEDAERGEHPHPEKPQGAAPGWSATTITFPKLLASLRNG